MAREAVRDRDKFKDPETKKILKKFGLDVTSQAKLTDSMRKRAADQMIIDKKKRAGGRGLHSSTFRHNLSTSCGIGVHAGVV